MFSRRGPHNISIICSWQYAIFSFSSILSYVLGAQKNRLIKTVLLSTHNICFISEIRNLFLINTFYLRPAKIIVELSVKSISTSSKNYQKWKKICTLLYVCDRAAWWKVFWEVLSPLQLHQYISHNARKDSSSIIWTSNTQISTAYLY